MHHRRVHHTAAASAAAADNNAASWLSSNANRNGTMMSSTTTTTVTSSYNKTSARPRRSTVTADGSLMQTISSATSIPIANGGGGGGVGGGNGSPPPRQRRRRIRRKPSAGGDGWIGLTCIIVLVVLVSVMIIGGLVIVIRLLSSSGGSIFGLGGGGQQGRRPPHPSARSSASSSSQNRIIVEPPREFPELPASPIYTIPHSMAHIGDRSDTYARLRKTFDAQLPYDPERSLQAMDDLVNYPNIETFAEDVPYDIHNCPDVPPPGYPHEWQTLKVLEHWSPEDTTNIPSKIHQGLCVFDYRKDYVKALQYRQAELPFVVRGDPEVAAAVERWNTPTYLDHLMGRHVEHRAEISMTNHFMYWVPGDARLGLRPGSKQQGSIEGRRPFSPMAPEGWTAPTKMIRMTYPEFLQRANITDRDIPHDEMHWYFRLIGCGETGPTGDCDLGSSEWLFDELTFFQPRPHLLYLADPAGQRGIHCRIGMQGVTIANHFDSSRNAIAVLGGERRYILSHPKHCPNLALYAKGHPSARHSAVDWSHPDLDEFPEFAQAQSNEVLLQAGDVLFLPTNWFHYIVSLGLNFQCNTRSGTEERYMPPIRECGF